MALSSPQAKDAMLKESVSAEELSDSEFHLELPGPHPWDPRGGEEEAEPEPEPEPEAGGRSLDGDLQGCQQLEQRWILWHQFMKEHGQLEAWLQAAEGAVASCGSEHVPYVTAREQLRRLERLQQESRSSLVQLDSLTQRNRTLSRCFGGAMRARLLTSARESSLRWDAVSAKLESIAGPLKLFVAEWEEFETEREELACWLSDLDLRLTQVEHLTENTCEKLRQLQSFQECVCVNSGRINALLQRGEALIQRSTAGDAQRVEARLLELLRCCSRVYNNIARTHTRLLSMRLVFEDDWILSQAPDSGCPSESLLEEEGAHEKLGADPPAISDHPNAFPHPPSPSHPSHEHQGLEWDPSVDVGRSVSRDDADSSYFSASAGLCHRDGLKRWSYLSSLGSQSDISNDISHQEAEGELLEEWDPSLLCDVTPREVGAGVSEGQRATAAGAAPQDVEPAAFDGGRVREWLGVQSPAPPHRGTSCCKAVQTEGQPKVGGVSRTHAETAAHTPFKLSVNGSRVGEPRHHQLPPCVGVIQSCHDDAPAPPLPRMSSQSPSSDWSGEPHKWELEAEEEQSCCEEAELQRPEQSRPPAPAPLPPAPLLCLLLGAALALLAALLWDALQPPCHKSSKVPSGLHLRYVNGPPPT